MSLGVRKFHLNDLEPNSVILLLGNNDHLVSELIDQLPNVQDGLIIDGGALPDSEGLVIELIRDHIKQQKQRLNDGDNTPSYLVLENCCISADIDFWKLLNVILRNRSTLHDTVFLCGDHTSIPDGVLAEVDYCLMFNESDTDKLKERYTNFGRDIFKNLETFETVYNQITSDAKDCLVLDYTKPKLTMKNSVFWHSVV